MRNAPVSTATSEPTGGRKEKMMNAQLQTEHSVPPAEHPERGAISYAGAVFDVEHWVEGGEHVFRSTEFDLTVGDPDIRHAVDKFVEGADDLWSFLEEQEKLTEGELELVSLLASRFREVLHELDRRERSPKRLIRISLPRQRGEHLRTWRPASPTPGSSSHLSHV
jgi:hypothetical protein